jgi:hypothetical protein
MTPKEQREYEEGKAYGYDHPHKVAGWFKSAAWNEGLRAGQAEYGKDHKKEQAKLAAYRERERRKQEALSYEKPKW